MGKVSRSQEGAHSGGGIDFQFSVQILGLQFEPKSWAQNWGSIFGIFNTTAQVYVVENALIRDFWTQSWKPPKPSDIIYNLL